MPWCPKCKNEYREGITVCVDCNEELVEDLGAIESEEKELVFTTEHKEKTDAFIKYLEYSGIHSYSVESDENDFVWSLYVSKADHKNAAKLFTGFALTESERAIAEQSIDIISSDEDIEFDDSDDSDDSDYTDITTDNDLSENEEISDEQQKAIDELNEHMEFNEIRSAASTTYVRKADKAKDYITSAYTNIICGAVGLIFIALNMIGIIEFVTSTFSQIVFLIMFLAFLISGIKMYISSKTIAEDANAEEALEKSIVQWLNDTVNNEYLESIRDTDASDEINYFNYLENIRMKTHTEFPDADAAMIETLVDEHLTKLI